MFESSKIYPLNVAYFRNWHPPTLSDSSVSIHSRLFVGKASALIGTTVFIGFSNVFHVSFDAFAQSAPRNEWCVHAANTTSSSNITSCILALLPASFQVHTCRRDEKENAFHACPKNNALWLTEEAIFVINHLQFGLSIPFSWRMSEHFCRVLENSHRYYFLIAFYFWTHANEIKRQRKHKEKTPDFVLFVRCLYIRH